MNLYEIYFDNYLPYEMKHSFTIPKVASNEDKLKKLIFVYNVEIKKNFKTS